MCKRFRNYTQATGCYQKTYRVLPVTHKIYFSTEDGIIRVELLPTFEELTKGSHACTRFPDGSLITPKFEGWAAVAWVHGDELIRSCLAIGINNLETLVFKLESLDNGQGTVAVGGCR